MLHRSDYDTVPEFAKVEGAVHWLTAHDSRLCAEKIRLYFVESEGYESQYHPFRDVKFTPTITARAIVYYGLCRSDEAFRTGWIERDGTLRSNDYTCHAQHVDSLKMQYCEVERLGWLHVSTDHCTAYFEPSKAQIAEIERLDKPWNSKRELPRFIPIKKGVRVLDQVEDLRKAVMKIQQMSM